MTGMTGLLCHARIVVLFVAFIAAAIPGAVAAQEEVSKAWYDTEDLNTGLGAVPEDLNRQSPRATMRSFLDVADQNAFEQAAHLLNLAHVPEDKQAAMGPELARKLYEVIGRQVWLNWSSVPSRPDARPVQRTSGEQGQSPQFQRNFALELFELKGRAYEIALARYKAEGSEQAVWLFTPQTVEDVETLHDAYGPRAFEKYIPAEMKQELGRLKIWEWVGLPIMFLVLAAIGWCVHAGVQALSRHVSRDFLRNATARASAPLALVAVSGAAQVVLGFAVSFSGPVTSVVAPILVILMVAGIGIAALHIVDAILDRITRRYVGEIDDARSVDQRELYTSIYALRRIVVLLMVGFAAIYVLSRLQLFETIGITLLASAGVLTVLLGIAGQAVLGNILASLQIALAKPVRIGDSVLFEGDWAYVESIFYTFLRLRTWDERRIIVPVRYFVSKPFENWSVKDARIMQTVVLKLDHSADSEVLRDRFEELAKQDEDIIEHDQLACFVTSHDDQGQEITFYALAPDPSTGWLVEMRLREGLLKFIRDEYPQWWPRDRIQGNETAGATGDSA